MRPHPQLVASCLTVMGFVAGTGRAAPVGEGGSGGSTWSQQAKLVHPAALALDEFGGAVALGGDTLLVGSPGDDQAAPGAGSVHVFARSPGGWVTSAVLFEPQPALDNAFGSAVALDQDTALIGVPFAFGDDSGCAYAYERQGGTWTPLLPAAGEPGAQLGWSVALDGHTAVVGAPRATGGAQPDAGAVYVFERSGVAWSQTARLAASDPTPGAAFGHSVAIHRDIIVVGSPSAQGPTGVVYVFERIAGQWVETTRIVPADVTPTPDRFGEAVDTFGDWIAIGRPLDVEPGGSARIGSAYLFYNHSGWIQKAKVFPGVAKDGGRFGQALSLYGSRLVVGQPGEPGAPFPEPGKAYVFSKSFADWLPEYLVTAADPADDDRFGGALALERDTLVVGAPAHSNLGAAYGFARSKLLLYVDDAAQAGGNGSQASPFRDIAEGLAVADHGDEVVVLDGTYRGPGNRNLSFHGRDILLRSQSGPAQCTIDCEGVARGFELHEIESALALVEGFTVLNGNSAGGTPGLVLKRGGGFFVTACDVTIRNCVVMGSTAEALGGGMFFSDSRSLVEGCSIVSNRTTGSVGGGGGVATANYPDATSPVFSGCVIQANVSGGNGGGAYFGSQSPTMSDRISHCRILRNFAHGEGGGVYTKGNVRIETCLIAGNIAAHGGGIAGFGPTRIASCTVVDNGAFVAGGGLHRCCGGETWLVDSIVWENRAPLGRSLALTDQGTLFTALHTDLAGGPAAASVGTGSSFVWGAGNIVADPLFVDPDGSVLGNDYRLRAGSPCADAGDNAWIPPDDLDLDADLQRHEAVPFDLLFAARIVDDPTSPNTGGGVAPFVDMGAYERQP